MRKKLKTMYDYQYPVERRVIEDRLFFLEREYSRFDYMINPYHIQPGLILDVDITSIKRKKATLNSMANVLNEFLHGVSKGFQDAAFASFSRRRSTVREDINQSFGSAPEEKHGSARSAPAAKPASAAYLDMINSGSDEGEEASVPAIEAPKSEAAPKARGRGAAKAKDKAGAGAAPKKSSGAPGKRGRPLREV